MYELGIINGRIYQGKDFKPLNIYVSEGEIREISKEKHECKEVIDATKRMVLPGLIDPHVHMALNTGNDISADDFVSGSKTAAYGGVTTIIDFVKPISHENEWEEALKERLEEAQDSCIDYSFHATAGEFTGNPEALKKLCKGSGIPSVKLFTTYSESKRRNSYQVIEQFFDPEMVVLVHCEEESLIKRQWKEVKTYEKSRPVMAERAAAMKIGEIAEKTGHKAYIVHISSGSTLDVLKLNFRSLLGKTLFLESSPHYFALSDMKLSNTDGQLYLVNPPLRGGKELMRLRNSIHLVDTIGSDHCPYHTHQKMVSDNASLVPKGFGGIEPSFPIMFNLFGEKIIPLYTSKPAQIFGLKNKGELRVGKDADIMIYDSTLSVTIKETHSNGDYSVYEGLKIRGKVETTIARGKVIMHQGEFYGGQGRFIRR